MSEFISPLMITIVTAHLIIIRGRARRYNRKKPKTRFDMGNLLVDFAIDLAFLYNFVPHVADA